MLHTAISRRRGLPSGRRGEQLNIINVGYDSTNYYVLANATSRLLIDVGWPGTLPKLRHQLRAKGVALEELTHLLVTHYHPDHAGLTQEVKDLGVRLLVLEEQFPAIPELRRYMKPEHPYRDITLHDSIVIKTAESRAVLRRLGIDGEVIHTPGHSDDSVTLVADSGIAFVGDLPGPMYLLDNSLHTIKHSWEAIRARGVYHVYPGHGPIRPLELGTG